MAANFTIITIDDLVSFVESRDYVTLAELERYMPAMREEPRVQWGFTPNPGLSKKKFNILLWVGGESGIELVEQALDERRICLRSAQMLTYVIDGHVLQPQERGVKWLPICLRPARYGVLWGDKGWLVDRDEASRWRSPRKKPSGATPAIPPG